MAERQFNAETLEIDDHKEYYHRRQQTWNIWRVFSIECMLEGENFVGLGEERVEEGNDSSFELGVLLGLDRDWWKAFPEDDFADISGNKQTDTITKTISLLEQFIEQLDNQTSES